MSGTSVDSVDAIAVKFSSDNKKSKIIGFVSESINSKLQNKIRNFSSNSPFAAYTEIDFEIGKLFANTINKLIKDFAISPNDIQAIGSHGQTLFHAPKGAFPTSIQAGNPNIIASDTGITTIADFRRGDIAAGGEGAPLVPMFHAFLADNNPAIAFINIGGFCNITIFSKKGVDGFDIGPGNYLMDFWIQKKDGALFDYNGNWAASGKLQHELLNEMLSDPFFSKTPPKSTGFELFNSSWLNNYIRKNKYYDEDIQRTLCELTAKSIANSVMEYAPLINNLVLCGGGTYNSFLVKRIKHNLPNITITDSSEYGISPKELECCAFAWLAKRRIENETNCSCRVSGAYSDSICGGIYSPPAKKRNQKIKST